VTTDVQVRDHFITLNGLRFHYREWGDEQAPPVVLLHGAGSAASWMDELAAGLANQFHVFALDQRGYGETEWAEDYHLDRRVEDLAAFVDALGLTRFSVFGGSMGGIVAYLYAGRYPERPVRIVIGDIGPDIADIVQANYRQPPSREPQLFNDPEEAVTAARAQNPGRPEAIMRRRILNNLIQQPDGKWVSRNDPILTINDPARQVPTPEQWATFAKITCAVLILIGPNSPILSPATAERMVRAIPRGHLVEVPDYGHNPQTSGNEAGVLAVVGPFLLEGITS
jgi:pimeloyl-ACP methyl ester carboxylesterase